MRAYTLLLLVVVLLSSTVKNADAQTDRRRGADDMPVIYQPEGVVYALPRTGFIVEVTATKTIFKPGPYARYAKKYLGIEEVVEQSNTKWEIVSVGLEKFSEPDPDAYFKAMDTVAGRLSLLPNSIIAGINTETAPYNNRVIGTDFIVLSEANDHVFTDLSSDDFYDIIIDGATGTENIEMRNLEEKARAAADYIIKLRKKRAYEILDPSDAIPEDGKGYEVFVNEAKRLDEKYTELFTGKRFDSEHTFSFIFVPGNSNVRNEVLFRFSDEKGILAKSDMSGRPVFINLTREQQAFENAQKLSRPNNNDAGFSGVYYRIPVDATIAITDGINTIFSGKTDVAQFGVTAPLPDRFLNGRYRVQFHAETGSIKNISTVK